jgi:hypothetical protein
MIFKRNKRHIVYLCIAITMHTLALAAEDELVQVKIRTLGVGESSIRLSAEGLTDGASLLVSGSSINGPVTYFGPKNILLYEISEGQKTGQSHTIALPDTPNVILIGLFLPNNKTRFYALSDEYGERDRQMVSILNITSMDLYVRVEDTSGFIKPGRILRNSYELNADQRRLDMTMVGERNSERLPLVNSRLRMLPGRDLTLIVTGSEMSTLTEFSEQQIEISYVYHAPLVDTMDKVNNDSGSEHLEIFIKGGDPDG